MPTLIYLLLLIAAIVGVFIYGRRLHRRAPGPRSPQLLHWLIPGTTFALVGVWCVATLCAFPVGMRVLASGELAEPASQAYEAVSYSGARHELLYIWQEPAMRHDSLLLSIWPDSESDPTSLLIADTLEWRLGEREGENFDADVLAVAFAQAGIATDDPLLQAEIDYLHRHLIHRLRGDSVDTLSEAPFASTSGGVRANYPLNANELRLMGGLVTVPLYTLLLFTLIRTLWYRFASATPAVEHRETRG